MVPVVSLITVVDTTAGDTMPGAIVAKTRLAVVVGSLAASATACVASRDLACSAAVAVEATLAAEKS